MARYKDLNTGKIFEVDPDGTKRVIYDPAVDAPHKAAARQKFLIQSVMVIVFLLMASFAVMYRTGMIRKEKAIAQRRYDIEQEKKQQQENLIKANAEAVKRAEAAHQAASKVTADAPSGSTPSERPEVPATVDTKDPDATPTPADADSAGTPADSDAANGEMDSGIETNADVEAENYKPDFAAWAEEGNGEEGTDGEKLPPRKVEDMFKGDPNNPNQSVADSSNPNAAEDNNFQYRIWTDKAGGTVNAKLVGIGQGRITLANTWGEPRTFRWDDFSRRDIAYVRSLGFLKNGKRLPPDQRKPFKEEDEDDEDEEDEDEEEDGPAMEDYNALTSAIDAEDIPKLQELFKAGALKVVAKNSKGDTILHYAITYHSDNLPLIKCLIEDGKVDVNVKNKQGISPLKRAQEKEDTELCIFLEKHGAEE